MVFDRQGEDLILRVRVTPNAARDEAGGVFSDAEGQQWLQMRVRAVPDKGKANKSVIAFLAKQLRLPKSRIELVRGSTARTKTLCLSSAPQSCQKAIELLMQGD